MSLKEQVNKQAGQQRNIEFSKKDTIQEGTQI